jgi:uncharacterized protein
MSNPRHPFQLNVGFILHQEVGYSFQFRFEFDTIKVAEDLELQDFRGAVDVGRTPQGLLFTGNFIAQMSLECSRCLRWFRQALQWSFTELYALNEKSTSDSGLLVPEDARIDLQPLIREFALLEVPINPICKAECKGLCPTCGQDLNVRDCGHRQQAGTSAFGTLHDFFKP